MILFAIYFAVAVAGYALGSSRVPEIVEGKLKARLHKSVKTGVKVLNRMHLHLPKSTENLLRITEVELPLLGTEKHAHEIGTVSPLSILNGIFESQGCEVAIEPLFDGEKHVGFKCTSRIES